MTAGPAHSARLQMYDWPQTRAANDALWARWRDAIRDRNIEAPDSLDRMTTEETSVEDLLVGQVCGITYARALAGRVSLIATPCYDAEGCDGPNYCSMIVVRGDEGIDGIAGLAGRRAAVNSRTSFSGWFALHAATRSDEDLFGGIELTGSHLASARAVADGSADCAALDSVCWGLINRFEPDLARRLRVIDRSPSLPGLPLIAGPACTAETVEGLREALFEALADPAMASTKQALLLTGAEVLDGAAYRGLLRYA